MATRDEQVIMSIGDASGQLQFSKKLCFFFALLLTRPNPNVAPKFCVGLSFAMEFA